MPGLRAGPVATLDRYRSLLDRIEDTSRALGVPGPAGACGSCRACCGPLSLLPIEAHALLATGLLDERAAAAAACPLLDDGGCRAGEARPFACRVRGLPVLHLDAEGDWTSAGCRLGRLAGDAGASAAAAAAPIAEWAALLFRLDREFRAGLASRPGRTALAELCRAPDRYRALLSPAGARPFVSRVLT